MFKNLTLFRFPSTFNGLFETPLRDELEGIEHRLAEARLKPVGPAQHYSQGFIPPLGRSTEGMAHRVGDAVWLAVGREERLLPATVVNDLLQKKLDTLEEQPGARARKRIKQELVEELLPKAFVQPQRCDAYLDLARGFIAVDSASRKASESVVSELRHTVGSFPALPLNSEVAPRAVLTGWLAGEPLPEGFSIGDECELRDPSDDGVVKCQRKELQGDEIAQHLEAGMQCTRLALTFNDHVSFVFGEDLVIRKFKLLDGAADKLEASEPDDVQAELDARFALLTGEVGLLFDALEEAFKLSGADAAAESPSAPVAEDPAASRRKRRFAGVDTVTISGPGIEPITMTADDFRKAPGRIKEFNTALGIVREANNASISHLQRKMKIGYNAAARHIELMEKLGHVSPPARNGDRTVLPLKDPA